MALTVEKDGQQFSSVLSASVGTSLRSLSGSFSIEASANSDAALPVKAGDKIRILADDEPILTGFVDTLNVEFGGAEHSIRITGRDKTQDVIDSSVSGEKEFSGGVTLESVIANILKGLGITDISVINDAGIIPPFSADEVVSASVGQSCLDFLNSYAVKKQVLLTTDGKGNIVIARGRRTPSGLSLLHLLGVAGAKNNVLNARLSVDVSKRYSDHIIRSQGNPVFSLSSTSDKVTDIKGASTDAGVRSTRKLELQAEESMTAKESGDRAIWEANLRRANSLVYEATVQGHSSGDQIWRPNQLVNVIDEFADLQASMLISDVSYEYDLDQGSLSRLTLVSPDAFTLQAELDALTSNTSKIGDLFTL